MERPPYVGIAGLLLILAGAAIAVVPRACAGGSPDATNRARGEEAKVRKACTLAGTWYDADPTELTREIRTYLQAAEIDPVADVRALILPHAGYRWSGATAAFGVRALGTARFTRVLVLGPSHRYGLENLVALPRATHFETPLGDIELDADFLAQLEEHPSFRRVPEAHAHEHSVEIELPLLQSALETFRLVPLVVGDLDAETAQEVADALLSRIDDQTLVVASSDFTHYGDRFAYLPFEDDVPERIKELDMGAVERIRARDAEGFRAYVDRTRATICGRRPIEVLLRMLPEDARPALLAYRTSGQISGEWDNSVSYAALAFGLEHWPAGAAGDAAREPLTREDGARLLKLARDAVRYYLELETEPDAADLGFQPTEAMRAPHGVFTTLRNGEELRGCIGQLRPRAPLWKTVVRTAIGAARYDRRFASVSLEELPSCRIKISVLTAPAPVSSWREIVLGRHGVVLTKDGATATFLPEVATDMGWTLEEMLSHLARKAGLEPDAWREGARFEVFESLAFGEDDGGSHGDD